MKKLILTVALIFSTACATPGQKIDPALIVTGSCCALSVGAVGGFAYYQYEDATPDIKVPGYGTLMEPGPFSADEVSELMQLFQKKWEEKFGPNPTLKEHFDRLNIYWVKTDQIDTVAGPAAGIVDAYGSSNILFRGRIRVAYQAGLTLQHSALIHELCHIALAAKFGDGDATQPHEAPPGPWTVEVNDFIVEMMRLLEKKSEEPQPTALVFHAPQLY